MLNVDAVYARLHGYGKKKDFKVTAAHDASATLVNNLQSLSGQCNNIADVLAQIEKAKTDKDGDAMDKALDDLKARMKEFTAVGKICKSEMLNYLKPMIKE